MQAYHHWMSMGGCGMQQRFSKRAFLGTDFFFTQFSQPNHDHFQFQTQHSTANYNSFRDMMYWNVCYKCVGKSIFYQVLHSAETNSSFAVPATE